MSETIEYEIVCTGKVHEPYEAVEYKWIDYKNSWKKCKCGRVTHFLDNYCPTCGQKLAMPPRPEI